MKILLRGATTQEGDPRTYENKLSNCETLIRSIVIHDHAPSQKGEYQAGIPSWACPNPRMNRLRYVILHHKLSDGEHWDLMLEQDGLLATWQLLTAPKSGQRISIPAIRIDNHRLAYLDYEGPISGNRGCVSQYDAGTYAPINATPSMILFQLDGSILHGNYALVRTKDAPAEQWQFQGLNRPL